MSWVISSILTSKPIAEIDEWIATRMKCAKEYCLSAPVAKPPLKELDLLFRAVLREAWR